MLHAGKCREFKNAIRRGIIERIENSACDPPVSYWLEDHRLGDDGDGHVDEVDNSMFFQFCPFCGEKLEE
jgi:hypothetical protein